jgi:hypothetical protein
VIQQVKETSSKKIPLLRNTRNRQVSQKVKLSGTIAHACNLSTQEAEAGRAQFQTSLGYSETLSQKTSNKKNKVMVAWGWRDWETVG